MKAQMRLSIIALLGQDLETFKMLPNEIIDNCFSFFKIIVNELHVLRSFHPNEGLNQIPLAALPKAQNTIAQPLNFTLDVKKTYF